MLASVPLDAALPFRLLILSQALWGERIADNICQFHPAHWVVNRWKAPAVLPLVVDDGLDYLPPTLPAADVLLAVGDTPGVAQLVPDAVRLCGARAVIAPIDRNESLPAGLVKQLRGWLADLGVPAVFPKPFCSLTETTFNLPPIQQAYDLPLVAEFARHFGQPGLRLAVDAAKTVTGAGLSRDAACGCARHVAAGLVGRAAAEAEHEAGMLHHHYPCLASMSQDTDYRDTLMHVSGNIVRDAVRAEVVPHLDPVPYFRPHGRLDSETD
jgi:hypothetical protein